MSKTGIYEWADNGLGIENGCEHGCLYCYAAEKKIRLGLVADRAAWLKPAPRKTFCIPKGQRLMFPTTHDITPRNYRQCERAISRMLAAGRRVLAVSKPHFECVERLVTEHPAWRNMGVEFRFAIGGLSKALLGFWEPNAPSALERLYCIQYARERGFRVSVSAEPCLDWGLCSVFLLAEACFEAGADHIWFGLLNQWERRLAHLSDAQRKAEPYVILKMQHEKPGLIQEHCRELRRHYAERVVWKDSVRKLVEGKTP